MSIDPVATLYAAGVVTWFACFGLWLDRRTSRPHP
jgi:hypothetical protein